MPPTPQKKVRALEDFAEFLEELTRTSPRFLVIGGCAVGAYARLMGVELGSADLDLYMTERSLTTFLDSAPAHGIVVRSRPQPRALPVAFLEWRSEEINILTWSTGLPPPEQALRGGREFMLQRPGVTVLLADPFDLLSNKLAVRREKDLPHIAILRRFVEQECVEAFRQERSPRERLAPASQLLEATGTETLPPSLFEAMLPLARLPSDLRFLVHRAPDRLSVDRLLERVRSVADEPLRAEIESIARTLEF